LSLMPDTRRFISFEVILVFLARNRPIKVYPTYEALWNYIVFIVLSSENNLPVSAKEDYIIDWGLGKVEPAFTSSPHVQRQNSTTESDSFSD
jgi:hypothetical protein